MTDDDYDALSQKQLASIKRDMRISLEDAAVRATYKVMAELETEQNQGEEHMTPKQEEALAQPEQEPVGCIPWHWVDKAKQIADGTIAYPDVERAQQAIALIKILLKSTPPQRTWVGLTDDELIATYESEQQGRWGDHVRGLRAVEEAAHGIKE